ncbi:hypothetical protein PG996_006415 [Apiospora saccharicola]|uniref:Uncharacterized protein n=1 Tax=Apiospora saccharicola TaxID=335842 RepID=A0ABR1VPB0_9PEZI
MGLTPSKPATSPPVICHEGRFVPTSGYVCHAPGPNTYLRAGFDRRIISEYCHPNVGGKISSRVIYTGKDGSEHEQQSRSNPQEIPDDWSGLLDFDYDIPYSGIKADTTVKLYMSYESSGGLIP